MRVKEFWFRSEGVLGLRRQILSIRRAGGPYQASVHNLRVSRCGIGAKKLKDVHTRSMYLSVRPADRRLCDVAWRLAAANHELVLASGGVRQEFSVQLGNERGHAEVNVDALTGRKDAGVGSGRKSGEASGEAGIRSSRSVRRISARSSSAPLCERRALGDVYRSSMA